MKFSTPDLSDKRIIYASSFLENMGLTKVNNKSNADFILLGVNPDKKFILPNLPIFAGNINAKNVFDYTKLESFALKNAYLTAEGAISLAIEKSDFSLINSQVLITGYGRIGKALHKYLTPFTKNITVCARDEKQRITANYGGAKTDDFTLLKQKSDFDYIFNTVPHPVFNKDELSKLKKGAILIDLASFPGGVDRHYARIEKINLLQARGLPSLYSPAASGKVVGETVYKLIEEGEIWI